jgi:hypothetical protein
MSPKLRVEPISAERADEFWKASARACAFTKPSLLACCADKVDWWGTWRSEDLVATWPICRDQNDTSPRSPTFLYYVGPMFSGEIQLFKYHRYQAIRQQALEAMLSELAPCYPGLRFAMPPGETDIRAFEWWAHEHPDRASISFKPRHTARIHNLDRSLEEIRGDFARNRKRDLRMPTPVQPVRIDDWKMQELIDLHNEPIHRQGMEVSKRRITALERVVESALKGNGDLLAWRDPDDGHLASFILLLYGREEANDVLCVASEAWRSRGLAAWTTWQGIKQARSAGKTIFDFNGANSPRRAADKHSFNAIAELYFNIACEFSRK